MKKTLMLLAVLALSSCCFAAKVEIGKNNEIKLEQN